MMFSTEACSQIGKIGEQLLIMKQFLFVVLKIYEIISLYMKYLSRIVFKVAFC